MNVIKQSPAHHKKRQKHCFKCLRLIVCLLLICFIVAQFIDFPFGSKKHVDFVFDRDRGKLQNCDMYETKDAKGNVVAITCKIEIPTQDIIKPLSQMLGLDNDLFQKKICINSKQYEYDLLESSFIKRGKGKMTNENVAKILIEYEKPDGSSDFDVRNYGILSDDNRCIELATSSTASGAVPVFPTFQPPAKGNFVIKGDISIYLVNGWISVIVLYIATFLLVGGLVNTIRNLWND